MGRFKFWNSPIYFYNVTVFGATGPLGDSLRVKGERITAIGGPPHKGDCGVDGQGGLLIPGLINAHDHLELNTFKRLKYRERYTHSVQWIEDIEARFESHPDLVEPRQQPLNDRLLIGVVKNVLSGVTTVCHHNPLYRFLRRQQFVRVVKYYGFSHSLFRGDDPPESYKKTKPTYPWIIHLAEGIDDKATKEFEQLQALGAMRQNTVLVHGVGLSLEQQRCLVEQGGGLIWCPGSNTFMFGKTAQIQILAQAGKLALGSDSRLSGEFDLLHELQVAKETKQLSAEALFRTVTTDAARLLRLQHGGRGELTVGGIADLLLLLAISVANKFAAITDLQRNQLALVMLAGKPVIGSPELQPVFKATHTPYTLVLVDDVEKLMMKKLAHQLKKSLGTEPGIVL